MQHKNSYSRSLKVIPSFSLPIIVAVILLPIVMSLSSAYAAGNQKIASFNKAKKLLEQNVYYDHRETIYCGAKFTANKKIFLPTGFTVEKHKKRAQTIEWEHVVPAESFGRTFSEWREGHKQCRSEKGPFKGRKCAEKVNMEYRLMQADMYNLFPAIGAVNAMRQNYNFAMLPDASSDFGSCNMKIDRRKAEPPVRARGRIARTYLYMEATYPRYKMSKAQRKLMHSWDKMYPVESWECTRAKRIQQIQGNINNILKLQCE